MSTAPEAAPSERQQQLVREALHVVERCAKDLAARWSRFIQRPEELHAIGTLELYRVAHDFRDEMNPDFIDLARRRVYGAMLDTLRIENRHDRLRRALELANDRHLAEYDDTELNVLVHHEEEAEKRTEPFLQRVLAAVFAAGIDEVLKHKGEDAAAVREEYASAIASLRKVLPKLPRDEAQVILLVYSSGKTIDVASTILGITYISARRRHERGLDRLHVLLMAFGVTRAPPSMDVPGVGPALAANDGGLP